MHVGLWAFISNPRDWTCDVAVLQLFQRFNVDCDVLQQGLDVEHWRAKSEKSSVAYDTLKKLEPSVPCQPIKSGKTPSLKTLCKSQNMVLTIADETFDITFFLA